MFGRAPLSQTLSANKRLFGSSLTAFHLHPSFPGDLRNGMSFSQNIMPFTFSDPVAVPYLL